MKLVVDASVSPKRFFRARTDEPATGVAIEILDRFVAGDVLPCAPVRFRAEVCAVLAREAREAMRRRPSRLVALAIPVSDEAPTLVEPSRWAFA